MQAWIGGRGNKAVVVRNDDLSPGKPHSMLFDTWTEALAWCDKEGIPVFNREAADLFAKMESSPESASTLSKTARTGNDPKAPEVGGAVLMHEQSEDDDSQPAEDPPHWRPE
jgi:hypothetical protein